MNKPESDFLCTRCNHIYPIDERAVIFEVENGVGECRACHFECPENRWANAGGVCAKCFHMFPEALYCGCLGSTVKDSLRVANKTANQQGTQSDLAGGCEIDFINKPKG